MTERPETCYAKSGDVHIAYQVVGHGPLDLVVVPGFTSHLEWSWEHPAVAHFLERLASFSRVILFDKRGTGLSDRMSGIPTLEQRMDDVRAVMDAVGSRRAAVMGISEGGPMSLLFAATHPERTIALVLYGSYARRAWAPDHPYGVRPEDAERLVERIEKGWGRPGTMSDIYSPSADESYRQWGATWNRLAASPGAAIAILRMNMDIDVRHVLPTIRVPTLVAHRIDERVSSVGQARYLATHIAGAELAEFPGIDHTPWIGDADAILDRIERFLTGVHDAAEHDRVLATILFLDIVGSTERAANLGDRRWRELLDQYYGAIRREVVRFRGRELDTVGDGFFASFDGPARGIRCASSVREALKPLTLQVRAGLHTGECEVIGTKLGGIAVHIGARVAAEAAADEVLVSSTVKDLVAGSGLSFESRGTRTLKGVPGEWPLYAVAGDNGR